MPKNLLNLGVLRKAVSRLVNTQPIHVQTWIAVSGDGLTGVQSYAFSYSYVGAISDVGREVFRDLEGKGSGSISVKNMVITIPYISGMPMPQRYNQLILYRMDGTQFNRVRVLSIVPREAGTSGKSNNSIYAIECHVEVLS